MIATLHGETVAKILRHDDAVLIDDLGEDRLAVSVQKRILGVASEHVEIGDVQHDLPILIGD
jgi:hypothetical protein